MFLYMVRRKNCIPCFAVHGVAQKPDPYFQWYNGMVSCAIK